jgi:hypothetical protein
VFVVVEDRWHGGMKAVEAAECDLALTLFSRRGLRLQSLLKLGELLLAGSNLLLALAQLPVGARPAFLSRSASRR